MEGGGSTELGKRMIGNYDIPRVSIESGGHARRGIDSFMTQVVASFLQFANQEGSIVRGVLNDQEPEFLAQRTPGLSRRARAGGDGYDSSGSIVWKQLAPDKQRTQGQQTWLGNLHKSWAIRKMRSGWLQSAEREPVVRPE